MTNLEIFESGLHCNGELKNVIDLCEDFGNYCFIGGLALNAYCEPVFTADADIVLTVDEKTLKLVREKLKQLGFKTKLHKYWLSARKKDSNLQIQITRDHEYSDFPRKAVRKYIFGIPAMVADVIDLTKGKLMAFQSKDRSEAKKTKDRLDLIRLGVAYYDQLKNMLPEDILIAVNKDLKIK